MKLKVSQFEIKVAPVYKNERSVWLHRLRSIADFRKKILQRPFGVARGFSVRIITSSRLLVKLNGQKILEDGQLSIFLLLLPLEMKPKNSFVHDAGEQENLFYFFFFGNAA